MDFSTEQVAWIVEHYFHSLSSNVVRQRFNEKFGERSLNNAMIMRVVHRFQNEHTFKRLQGNGRMCSVRTPEKEEEVKQAITDNPRLFVRKIARMSNVSTGTAHITLRSLKPFDHGVHGLLIVIKN